MILAATVFHGVSSLALTNPPVLKLTMKHPHLGQGILKGGSITVPLTSCQTGLDQSVLQIKTKIVSCNTADSKPVEQEVNSTVILPPLVFPGQANTYGSTLFGKKPFGRQTMRLFCSVITLVVSSNMQLILLSKFFLLLNLVEHTSFFKF